MDDVDRQWQTIASALGVTVQQRSKTVWLARGEYKGQEFQVKGRSPTIALALWKEAARYTGSEW